MALTNRFTHSTYLYSSSFLDDLRDLPAFPTRRSSDLSSCHAGPAGRASRPAATSQRWTFGPAQARTSTSGTWPRSEEHTSELQSLRQLVCRLLLEKKKQSQKSKPIHVQCFVVMHPRCL